MILLMRVRVQQQNTFLLFNPREVEQVGVLLEQERAVRVGRQDVVGIDDSQRIWAQQFFQAGPIRHEQLRINGGVSHLPIFTSGELNYPIKNSPKRLG